MTFKKVMINPVSVINLWHCYYRKQKFSEILVNRHLHFIQWYWVMLCCYLNVSSVHLPPGAGLGLLYLPAIVSVGHYFKKRRALATGIAVCGSGIGGFVFAPLSEFLIETYTWQGAMIIISAIVLNGIPIAALLRPLEGSQSLADKRKQSRKEDRILREKLLRDGKSCESERTESTTKCCEFDLKSIFDFELLRSPTFLVYGTSCFLCMLGKPLFHSSNSLNSILYGNS